MSEQTGTPDIAPQIPEVAAVATSAERPVRKPSMAARVLAASAHLATLVSIPGLLVALAIWLVNRKRSAFVAHHARQAVVWQILSNVLLLVFVVLLIGTALRELGGTLNAKGSAGQADLVKLLGSLVGLYVVLLGALIMCWISAILGAFAALRGRGFRYPFIGRKRRG
ncbi:MAG TPA: DUF4870 domain-containing protein [Ktedonobacterales bacterium]|nr:DUF4870 domain-containing protein [Ktedonobacterales bacterium]